MLQPLHKLFPSPNHPLVPWSELDLRQAVQRWLQTQLASEQVYCEKFQGATATIRVASPASYQAVRLLEYDLVRLLKEETGVVLEHLNVVY